MKAGYNTSDSIKRPEADEDGHFNLFQGSRFFSYVFLRSRYDTERTIKIYVQGLVT